MTVVSANSLSASYFTYQDEYWTIFYVKPYTRINQFLIGAISGATYYSYQREWEIPSCFTNALSRIRESRFLTSFMMFAGSFFIFITVVFLQMINANPGTVPPLSNMLYLVFSRPIFITGFTMCTFPLILGSPMMRPLRNFLSHDFWIPFSRLSYGAFLSNEVFMVFRDFNTERGQWACSFDVVLFFCAYFTFSFFFAFIIGIFVEMPCLGVWYEFVLRSSVP